MSKDTCPICKQKTIVSINRETAYERGWGCLTCATAKEYTFTCQWEVKKGKVCKKSFKRYYSEEMQKTNIWSKYCDEHVIDYYGKKQSAYIPYPEFVTEKIKQDRKQFANDMLQSHRQGELSREFLEAHPNRARQMLRDGVITKEDVKNSRYVWKGDVPGVTKKIDAEALTK